MKNIQNQEGLTLIKVGSSRYPFHQHIRGDQPSTLPLFSPIKWAAVARSVLISSALMIIGSLGFAERAMAMADCPSGYYRDAAGNCVANQANCKEGLSYNPQTGGCSPNCTTAGTVWDPTTQQCVSGATLCDSESPWNPVTLKCETIGSCLGGTIWDATLGKCKPNCNLTFQSYDPITNTCVDWQPEVLKPVEKLPGTTVIRKYKNANLHNCLVGAKDPAKPLPQEYDCIPTPQNDDGSLSNPADKDYTKWSDDLYPGKSRIKPINGFYSKKLVRCDDATAPSEQCPIAVKAKFVITCKTKPLFWNASAGKCTEAQKIRTFYATYQAFTIPGQKPIKPNIVGDPSLSNTPATSIAIDAIKGEAP